MIDNEEIKEMEKELDLIEEMQDIEDEMILFLDNQSSCNIFIEETINKAFKQGGIKINKLVKNPQEFSKFKKSIQDHFKWIKEHIDNEESLDDYRHSQIEISKAYCLFYKNAITNIHSHIDEPLVCEEFIKYFRTLESIYCI